jgi:hypothetical protein
VLRNSTSTPQKHPAANVAFSVTRCSFRSRASMMAAVRE